MKDRLTDRYRNLVMKIPLKQNVFLPSCPKLFTTISPHTNNSWLKETGKNHMSYISHVGSYKEYSAWEDEVKTGAPGQKLMMTCKVGT